MLSFDMGPVLDVIVGRYVLVPLGMKNGPDPQLMLDRREEYGDTGRTREAPCRRRLFVNTAARDAFACPSCGGALRVETRH